MYKRHVILVPRHAPLARSQASAIVASLQTSSVILVYLDTFWTVESAFQIVHLESTRMLRLLSHVKVATHLARIVLARLQLSAFHALIR